MAEAHRIMYGDYEGNGVQNVYLMLSDNDPTQVVLRYERFLYEGDGSFDIEGPVQFSTNVKLDDIRDLYLALSTGDDIAQSFYSMDEDTLILVNVDDGLATMKVVTAAGEEITPDFDPPMDDASYMQYGIYKLLEEVK